MTTESDGDIPTGLDARVFWWLLGLLFGVATVLIWSGVVGLRYGDYSARLVLSLNMRTGWGHYSEDIWRHIWPPLPFLLNRFLANLALWTGMSMGLLIKCLLWFYCICCFSSLVIVRRISGYYGIVSGATFATLMLCALPIFHVISTSIASQAVTLPIMLYGFWVFIRRYDAGEPVYWAGVIFFAANLCRADSILYSGMLSFLLLARKEWVQFVVFNLMSSAFFLVHQTVLTMSGSRSYFSFGEVYDYSGVTFDEKIRFLGRQLSQTFGVEQASWAWGLGAVLLVAYAGGFVYLYFKAPGMREKKSCWGLLAWSGALLFVIVFPLVSSNGLGRHSRDYLFGLGVICVVVGFALAHRFEGNRFRWGVVVILSGLSGYSVYSAIPIRQPSNEIDEAAQWLKAHRESGDAVIFESDWSHYLSATTMEMGGADLHWTYAKSLYLIEMGLEPSIDGIESAPIYTKMVNSAARFLEDEGVRYIVSPAINTPERLQDKKNARSLHRLRPGYLLSGMRVIDADSRRLVMPGVLSREYALEKVYDSKVCHIWEVHRGD